MSALSIAHTGRESLRRINRIEKVQLHAVSFTCTLPAGPKQLPTFTMWINLS
jgi:hypothetical protein